VPFQGYQFSSSDKTIVKNDWSVLLKEMPLTKGLGSTGLTFQKMIGPLLLKVTIGFNNRSGSYQLGYHLVNLAYECQPRNETILDAVLSNWAIDYIFTENQGEHKCGHKDAYLAAFENLKRQCPISLSGPVTLDDIFHGYSGAGIEDYDEKLPLPAGYAACFSYAANPVLVAAWAGENKKAREYLEWGCDVLFEDTKPFGTKDGFYRFCSSFIEKPEILRDIAHKNLINGAKFNYYPWYMLQSPYQDIDGVSYKRPANIDLPKWQDVLRESRERCARYRSEERIAKHKNQKE
jgi:hypothetical protein